MTKFGDARSHHDSHITHIPWAVKHPGFHWTVTKHESCRLIRFSSISIPSYMFLNMGDNSGNAVRIHPHACQYEHLVYLFQLVVQSHPTWRILLNVSHEYTRTNYYQHDIWHAACDTLPDELWVTCCSTFIVNQWGDKTCYHFQETMHLVTCNIIPHGLKECWDIYLEIKDIHFATWLPINCNIPSKSRLLLCLQLHPRLCYISYALAVQWVRGAMCMLN